MPVMHFLSATFSLQILVRVIEKHYLLRRKVLYFVYGLRRAVRNVVWVSLIVAVWNVLFRYPTDHTVKVLTEV